MKEIALGIGLLLGAFALGLEAGGDSNNAPSPPKLHSQCVHAIEYSKTIDGILGDETLELKDMLIRCEDSYKE